MTDTSIAVAVLRASPDVGRRYAEALSAAGMRAADQLDGNAVIALVARQEEPAAGLEAIRAVSAAHPDARLIAVMPSEVANVVLRRTLLAGAQGIVLECDLDAALAPTIRAVAAGQLVVPPALRGHVAPRSLSYREKEILGLVVHGLTNRQVADRLYVAESTVKTHLSSAFAKLDAHSRSEAAARVLDPDAPAGLRILSVSQGPDGHQANGSLDGG